MVYELRIPEVGESVQEVQVGRWLVDEGQWVQRDQDVVEIETDKASVEIPAPASGVVTRILKRQGEPAEVGEVIGYLEEQAPAAPTESGGAAAPAGASAARERTPASHGPSRDAAEQAATAIPQEVAPRTQRPAQPAPGGQAAPAAVASHTTAPDAAAPTHRSRQRTARDDGAARRPPQEASAQYPAVAAAPAREARPREEKAVPPRPAEPAAEHAPPREQLSAHESAPPREPVPMREEAPSRQPVPTGEPVAQRQPPPPSLGADTTAAPPAQAQGVVRQEQVVPMTLIRRRIAQRLVEAQHNAALLTTFNEVDMSAVIEARRTFRDVFQEKYGVKLGFMSFFVKAAIEALKDFPAINAEVRGTNIVYRNYYDIGIAVGSQRGLVVPVLRNAHLMSFAEIERAIADLASRANDNRLRPDELEGGTFTISNGGVYGSLLSTPIVNPPQSGVLGLHAIQERPVARDGQVVIRPMMYVALTYDHRVVDGREAVTFLRRIKEIIESPLRLMLEV
jgi:2-oxoglutarate dehydrogenase E2 component (dihydrolipoamide succinyltransferase)